MNRKVVVNGGKKKYQYYIKERKNAVDVQLVMPSVRKRLFLWSRTKKALSILRLMKVSVCVAINASRCVR